MKDTVFGELVLRWAHVQPEFVGPPVTCFLEAMFYPPWVLQSGAYAAAGELCTLPG